MHIVLPDSCQYTALTNYWYCLLLLKVLNPSAEAAAKDGSAAPGTVYSAHMLEFNSSSKGIHL